MSSSKDKNGSPNRSKKEKDKDSKSQKKESEPSFPLHHASGVHMVVSPNKKNGQKAASGSSQSQAKHGGDHSSKYPTPRKRFICSTCGNSYANDKDLREHTEEAHQSPRYACEKCRQKFRRPGELARHRLEVHAPKSIMRVKSDREPSGKRSLFSLGESLDDSSQKDSSGAHRMGYACRVCGLAFSTRERLQNHFEIHQK